MERNHIKASILSLSAPGMAFIKDKEEEAALCRYVNDYGAALRDQNPEKLGFFATLPDLGETKTCIDEIAYALDTLKADGITLLTSYGGRYLGHPDFKPIWHELNRRKAVVFIHPTLESMTGSIASPWLPPPIIDFPHETTRTAVHLVISNTVRENRDCRIILSHAGGTLPFIATRIAHQSADLQYVGKSADEFLEDARSFYFDLALSTYDDPLDLLVRFARPDRILYGSDFPFAREGTVAPQLALLDRKALPDDVRTSIMSGAALKLFPRFGEQSVDEE